MTQPAFITFPERSVKLTDILRSQILLDFRVRFAAASRMQRGLIALTIAFFVALEIAPVGLPGSMVVRPLIVAQLQPPVLAQLVKIARTGPRPNVFRLLGFIVVVSIGDDHRVAMAQRILVKED